MTRYIKRSSMPYKIILKQGNLLKENADFIANASSTKLILGSGISMAVKRHCRIELQKEMDLYLDKKCWFIAISFRFLGDLRLIW